MARFRPGESGNPKGKRSGTSKIEPLRAAIREHMPEVTQTLVEQALAGDAGVARLLLERAVPPVKPIQEPVTIPPARRDLSAKAGAILSAVSRGELAPMDAKIIKSCVASHPRNPASTDLVVPKGWVALF